MGACNSKGAFHGPFGAIVKAREGSSIHELAIQREELKDCELSFVAGTDYGNRLAKIIREDRLPEDDDSYLSLGYLMITLFDDDLDGKLNAKEIVSAVQSITLAVSSFGNFTADFGTYTQAERGCVIYDIAKDVSDLVVACGEDGATPEVLAQWLKLLDAQPATDDPTDNLSSPRLHCVQFKAHRRIQSAATVDPGGISTPTIATKPLTSSPARVFTATNAPASPRKGTVAATLQSPAKTRDVPTKV